jgi:hypothetical protein
MRNENTYYFNFDDFGQIVVSGDVNIGGSSESHFQRKPAN